MFDCFVAVDNVGHGSEESLCGGRLVVKRHLRSDGTEAAVVSKLLELDGELLDIVLGFRWRKFLGEAEVCWLCVVAANTEDLDENNQN